MRKILFGLLGTLIMCVSALAQTNFTSGKIQGNLLDEKNQALPFANVLLLKAIDSTLVKGTISNEMGNFTFEQVKDHQYIISVSSVGYKKYFTQKLIISPENQSIELEDIHVVLAANSLRSVTITAQKPLIEMQADKLIMNVENSIVATGNTVLELLQKAPGVVVDQNDNISLNGKTSILIYIDGKQTYMAASDLANLLKNMTSNQIEKLEIISNPSAKYDAAGKAIINIITKKDKNFGTNGSFNAGATTVFAPIVPVSEANSVLSYKDLGQFSRYSTGLNLNNRKGKVNLFGNFNYGNVNGVNNSQVLRKVGDTRYDQYAYSTTIVNYLNYKSGLDYFINKKTTVGFMINGNAGNFENPMPTVSNSYIKSSEGILQSSPITSSNVLYKWKNITFNGNFKHTFDSTGRELSADFDRSFYNNVGKERGLITHFFDNTYKEYGTPLKITNHIPNIYNITAGKIDYTLPFANKTKLELGAKSSWVTSDNDFRYFKNDSVDVGRTNHFVYKENINAVYGIFHKEINTKWAIQIGLRIEHTKSEGKSINLSQGINRNYINLFPSVSLKQNINKNNELSYTFSRRIDRPSYNKLNPFIYFSDPYNYSIGNEKLHPQYTNSFGLNYTYKHAYVLSFGYSHTSDFMAEIYKNAIDDPAIFAKIKASTAGTNVDPAKITFITTVNLATFNVANLGFSFPITVTKWWNINNNFTLLYVKYYGKVTNSVLDYEVKPYNFYSSHLFKLPKAYNLEASMWYNSKNIYGQIKVKEQYAINFGVKKTIKAFDLRISVNDIFATNRFRGDVNTGGIIYNSSNKSTNRSIGISVNYKFGNSNVKSSRNRSTATEAENNRVKIGN